MVDVQVTMVDGSSSIGPEGPAILDTGSQFITMRGNGALLTKEGNEVYAVPCDTQAVVAFKIGNRGFSMQAGDLAGQDLGNNRCVSNIQQGAAYVDSGDTFSEERLPFPRYGQRLYLSCDACLTVVLATPDNLLQRRRLFAFVTIQGLCTTRANKD
ncbi:hypothetical protein DENSPDRAFT_717067 [Dentipellis sp. KUC8613]|nr:hypothetical protein DENSPDRAFT_717067 [Dentipellis sp. KUC8613]